MLVDGSVEVGPLASDLHVRLVDAPAGRARPTPLPAEPLLDLGRILLNPAVDRRVVDRDTALAHHLLEIAIVHAIAAVPPDCPEHDLALEVASLEVRHGPLLPRSGPITADGSAVCNRAIAIVGYLTPRHARRKNPVVEAWQPPPVQLRVPYAQTRALISRMWLGQFIGSRDHRRSSLELLCAAPRSAWV